MREILFRGKDVYGKWLYGDLINLTTELKQICNHSQLEHAHGVNIKTIGQYTGLTDVNGTKIFEGDIVQSIELELKGVIIFDEYCRFMIKDIATNSTYLTARNNEEIVVIGNIHDNPEILEGE